MTGVRNIGIRQCKGAITQNFLRLNCMLNHIHPMGSSQYFSAAESLYLHFFLNSGELYNTLAILMVMK